MNTINTIDDLIQLLDANPHWVEALRARLLTRALLDLPGQFAQFVAEMNSFVAEMNSFVAEMNSFVAEMHRFVETTNARFATVETAIKALRDDMGPIKGAHARNAAIEEATAIARDMGLRRTRTLTRDDLWALTDAGDISDIPANTLRSFHRADLIMEATDQQGVPCYIAVEISFTANGRDTARAIRNADFLTRLTNKRAYAAVAGLRHDDQIRGSLESGAAFWYQLTPEAMEAE